MTLKFLIDECLSPELVSIAVSHGHYESTCVRNRGWAGTKDYALIEHVVNEDFTLVADAPASAGGQQMSW
jgi:predicted nuclease of predicted toxin-antitoxin system